MTALSERVRSPGWVGLMVFVVVLIGALVVRSGERSLSDQERERAIAVARSAAGLQERLGQFGRVRVHVDDLDGTLVRVTFRQGLRVVAEVAVAPDGAIRGTKLPTVGPRYGSSLSNHPLVLALMVIVFLLVTLRLPLRSLRNVDALACAGFVGCVVAEDRLLQPVAVVVGAGLLGYLGVRCLVVALGRRLGPDRSVALIWRLMHAMAQPVRTRRLAVGAGVMAVCVVLIAISATGVIDVGFASTAGATLLMRGVLPYGHMPSGLVHGDTYPLLNYVVYMPGAAFSPVEDEFGDMRSALIVAAIAAIAGAVGLAWAARRRLGANRAESLRVVIAWLAFPTTAMTAASGSNDLVLAALVIWAVALVAHAGRGSVVLAAAIWVKLAPIVFIPVWFARLRGRAIGRAASALAGVTVVMLAWLLALDGVHGVRALLDALSFQFTRGSLQSVWSVLGLDAIQPVAQAALIGFVAYAAVLLRTRLDAERDLGRFVALVAAVLIGVQVTANNWSTLYLCWTVPLVLVVLVLDKQAPSAKGAAEVGVDER